MITVRVSQAEMTCVSGAQVERALRETMRHQGVDRAELSVTFLADPEITDLHRRYLNRGVPADVLSFALHEDGEDPVGDIYVGCEQAVRQAAEAGSGSGEELVRLAVHGALHVLGHDHPAGPERLESEMFLAQEAIMKGLEPASSGTQSV